MRNGRVAQVRLSSKDLLGGWQGLPSPLPERILTHPKKVTKNEANYVMRRSAFREKCLYLNDILMYYTLQLVHSLFPLIH
jgi:hypothetical protein